MALDPTSASINSLSISIDAYGNAVDFEPVIASVSLGLHALGRWLNFSKNGPVVVDTSIWAESRDRVSRGRQDMDKTFHQLGNGLDSLMSANTICMKKAKASVRASAGSIASSSGESTTILAEAAEVCRRALRFTEAGAEHTNRIRLSLNELETFSRKIQQLGTEISDHMRPAEVVQVMLRIECSRLDEVARAPLEALCAEITRVCDRMNSTVEAEFELVAKTLDTVLAMTDFAEMLESRKQQSDLRRAELGDEMVELDQSAIELAERDQLLETRSASLGKAISGLMQAMQFQDIVGQRWEHVQDGFTRLAAASPNDPEAGWNAIVQQAQLDEANSEMAEALSSIEDGLQNVCRTEESLKDQLQATLADSRRQLMNVRMHAVLFEVWGLAKDNSAELLSIESLSAPLVQIAGKMGSRIGDVSHEMRIIALNAQIQAARFGSNTGLEVLAESLRHIADLMSDGGNALEGHARNIERTAIELRSEFSLIGKDCGTVLTECDVDFPSAVEQLLSQEDVCNRLLQDALSSLNLLAAARTQMETCLSLAVGHLEDIAELAQACDDFVEKHYRGEQSVQTLIEAKSLDLESARYTMASEKEVLLQLAGKPSPATENAKATTGELDLF